jgi:hypothetical protein
VWSKSLTPKDDLYVAVSPPVHHDGVSIEIDPRRSPKFMEAEAA